MTGHGDRNDAQRSGRAQAARCRPAGRGQEACGAGWAGEEDPAAAPGLARSLSLVLNVLSPDGEDSSTTSGPGTEPSLCARIAVTPPSPYALPRALLVSSTIRWL